MDNNETFTFRQYLERFVPNLTPDEFAALHWCYTQTEDLFTHTSRAVEYLVLRGFLEVHYHQFDMAECHYRITDAGRAKYRELTATE